MQVLAQAPALTGPFAIQQFWGAVIVVVFLVLVWLLPMTRRGSTTAGGGLVTGADNRYSTSKFILVVWTVVVAWMVLTEALVAAAAASKFSELLDKASDLYLVFLGGPYAAAAVAKLTTQSKIAQGTLTKTPAGSPIPLDVIADDNGNVDVYDFQYTLFNLVARSPSSSFSSAPNPAWACRRSRSSSRSSPAELP